MGALRLPRRCGAPPLPCLTCDLLVKRCVASDSACLDFILGLLKRNPVERRTAKECSSPGWLLAEMVELSPAEAVILERVDRAWLNSVVSRSITSGLPVSMVDLCRDAAGLAPSQDGIAEGVAEEAPSQGGCRTMC